MPRYVLTVTASITVNAADAEDAISAAEDLMRQRIASPAAELHIGPDDIQSADVEELAS